MKVNFKYNVGDTVLLKKLPSFQNMQCGKYIFESEFTPKEYKISKCKCTIKANNTVNVAYNLYAYCDDYIQFHNWIPEEDLEGTPNEHEETIEFISHDKELLSIGDTVIADAFWGDYEDAHLSPSLTFTYVGTIVGFNYEINEAKKIIRTALIERGDGTNRFEFTPYLVKNMDEKFAFEYVKFCKKERFNPIKEAERKYGANHLVLLQGIHLWGTVINMYNNWSKYRDGGKKKYYPRKRKPENPLKADINKLLKSLSEEQKEELKKQLLKD